MNGAEKGVTPLELGDLAAGYYLVAVQSAGYFDTQRNISVTPGSRETVQFTLIPLPAIPGKKYSTVTDINTGAVRNILYAGGWRIDAGGPSVSRVVVTVGKDAADDPDRFPLDGADVMITGKKDIFVLKQNTPLYNQGRYPGAGTWGIDNKLNSDDDNAVDRNEQFTLVLVPGPGQAIPFNEPLTVEIRPRIGASAVLVPPGGAPSQAAQPAVAAVQPVTTPAAAPGSSGSTNGPVRDHHRREHTGGSGVYLFQCNGPRGRSHRSWGPPPVRPDAGRPEGCTAAERNIRQRTDLWQER